MITAGQVLQNRYRIDALLGKGGMGAVFKAFDLSLHRTVAIKLLAPHLVWETDFVERFMREARAAANLRHPAIIDIHDVGQDGDDHFFIMAYLSGGTLKARIQASGHLPLDEVLRILHPISDALDYAHAEGLIHRDVKPANVMFDQRGQPVLTDFGIVKAAQETKLTATGTSLGTPQYMAPEQVLGKGVDGRSDQYALGIIAYELLTGKVPFDGESTTVILHKQVYEPPPLICSLAPGLPPAVDDVIRRVLAKTPADRYNSCSEFVTSLEHALKPTTLKIAPTPPPDIESMLLANTAPETPAPIATFVPESIDHPDIKKQFEPDKSHDDLAGATIPLDANRQPVVEHEHQGAKQHERDVVEPPAQDGSTKSLAETPGPSAVEPPRQEATSESHPALRKTSLSRRAVLIGITGLAAGGTLYWLLANRVPSTQPPSTETEVPSEPTPEPTSAKETEAPTATGSTSGGVAEGEIKVAIIAPLSGSETPLGESTRNGALLAIDQWNSRGGVLGLRIQPIVADGQCAADAALNAARKVVEQDGVKFIIGEVCSNASISISDYATSMKVIQISPASTNPAVTVDPSGTVKNYVFRTCYTNALEGTAAAWFALDNLKARTAFIFDERDNAYMIGLADYFEKAFSNGGGRVVGRTSYAGGDTDFTANLDEIDHVKPDVIYLPADASVANLMTRQAKGRSMTIPFVGSEGWYTPDLDLEAAENNFFTAHYANDDPRSEVQDFVHAFTQKYRDDKQQPLMPNEWAALGYDAASMLFQAIGEAGSDDPEVVKENFVKTEYTGVTGVMQFDDAHNPVKSIVIMHVRNGMITYDTSIGPHPVASPGGNGEQALTSLKVGLLADAGDMTQQSYNRVAWSAIQRAAQEFSFIVSNMEAKQPADYEIIIDQFAADHCGVVIAAGFRMSDAVAVKAIQYPDIQFAIVDHAYYPTRGASVCDETKKDCYADGGLNNVTSLMFREDQAGFLAGVVAAGVSMKGMVCTVAGMEIPPVQRFVMGYENGARWIKPDVKVLHIYAPSFTDPAWGTKAGNDMIQQGCDVVFGAGGETGDGGLMAAMQAGVAAIGVDVDQYETFPNVKEALITSAMKNVEAAVYEYLKSVHEQANRAGIAMADLRNGGIGLAPYHDWESKVPTLVKAKVKEAIDGLITGQLSTGVPF